LHLGYSQVPEVAREWALWYLGGIALPGVGFGMDVHTVKAGINYRFGSPPDGREVLICRYNEESPGPRLARAGAFAFGLDGSLVRPAKWAGA